MIHLDSAERAVDPAVLNQPGGFAWWYAELLNESGDGIVVIWSFGLPFLPGYRSAVERGEAQRPADRPSLNISVYEGGRPTCYVLHEFQPEDVHWDGADTWRFGESTFTVTNEGEYASLRAELCCPIAGGPEQLRGVLQLRGPRTSTSMSQQGDSVDTHRWTPLIVPGAGEFTLDDGEGYRRSVQGRGYFDRNTSTVGLHRLGIGLWFWGHAPKPHKNQIMYLLWPESDEGEPVCLGYSVSPAGEVTEHRDLQVRLPRRRRTFYGMPSWSQIEVREREELWLRLTLDRRVDDGPFYLRYVAETQVQGVVGTGSAEVIAPSRVDLARHRPLVRMRVGTDRLSNSRWLPLFHGASSGRIPRLLQRWRRNR